MKHVATALLFDCHGKLLIYLRDNKPTIPFPNCWDLFGGHVEDGETPEQALVREIREELGIKLKTFQKFRDYDCNKGDAWPNIKHVFWGKVECEPQELTLHEGQRLTSIDLSDRHQYKFANILSEIVDDFAASNLYETI